MSSDLQDEKTDERDPKKGSEQILRHEIAEGRVAIERPVFGLFLSGISAGLDIGFSLFLMAVMRTQVAGVLPPPVVEMLVANMYAVGFIFVVLGRSELFTEQTTLAVLPVLNRKASVAGLARTWAVVYAANLIGAAAFAGLAVLIGPALGVIDRRVFGAIASSVTQHPGHVILLSGLLAGWLMGLVSWLVAAARDTISQIVLTWLVASVIGFAHLHHVVVGSVEVLAGLLRQTRRMTVGAFFHFLVWATLGNAVGGPFFVAIIKYNHAIGRIEDRRDAAEWRNRSVKRAVWSSQPRSERARARSDPRRRKLGPVCGGRPDHARVGSMEKRRPVDSGREVVVGLLDRAAQFRSAARSPLVTPPDMDSPGDDVPETCAPLR